MADENFKDRVTQLLKGLLMPGSLEARDGNGNPIGNPARISSSVKEKSRVLEGEMGRLSQEVADLKKIKEELLAVEERLDYERTHFRHAETEMGSIFKMVQDSRDTMKETLYQIERKLREQELPGPSPSPSTSVPMEVCSDEDEAVHADGNEPVFPDRI